jgi:hypothetical protein
MTQGESFIGCRGACGAKQPDSDAAAQAGWRYLEITNGWRCGACDRDLEAASAIVGMGEDGGDPLDPTSRGALPKETASTITAPTVPRTVGNAGPAPGINNHSEFPNSHQNSYSNSSNNSAVGGVTSKEPPAP